MKIDRMTNNWEDSKIWLLLLNNYKFKNCWTLVISEWKFWWCYLTDDLQEATKLLVESDWNRMNIARFPTTLSNDLNHFAEEAEADWQFGSILRKI